MPVQHGDDRPLMYRALVQVHLFAPLKEPMGPWIKRAMTALIRGGFTAPELVDAGDDSKQHQVLECEVAVSAQDVFTNDINEEKG